MQGGSEKDKRIKITWSISYVIFGVVLKPLSPGNRFFDIEVSGVESDVCQNRFTPACGNAEVVSSCNRWVLNIIDRYPGNWREVRNYLPNRTLTTSAVQLHSRYSCDISPVPMLS